MKKYEVTYLTVAEENHNAGTVASILADNNAKIESVHLWGGRRKLAYPIKKQDQAFYTTVVFEAEPNAVQPIERALSLNDDALRSLVVVYTPGFFERVAAGEDVTAPVRERESKPARVEEVKEVVTEAPAEEAPADVTPEVAEAPAEEKTEAAPVEDKPKRTRAKKATAEETKVLDDKIDELLNEDITK